MSPRGMRRRARRPGGSVLRRMTHGRLRPASSGSRNHARALAAAISATSSGT
ncbi:hypothetical protein C7S16_5952 [Burkholderia thailandensis]|uniref:Uncharacterized protein n=1 Tax=Burkholderia thailandensis TaxID=57975 RepID=A0AAW9CKY0_BURTH|nr:hypothetical protein [Burkholderia thailandensis]MDW9251295.1 hypothetical protein [Burkholderia thailandensis]